MKYAQSLKVLVVEDNQTDRRILESMLTAPSNTASVLKVTDSLAGAIQLLRLYEFDIVILDLNLTDSHGQETLRKLIERFPSVAIVVNTGAYEDELGLQTLSLGAQDFLIKGKYDAYVLNKVLHYAVERKRVEYELHNAYQQLKDAQSQLIQVEKMKVVGGLASGVAHEVKNPLSTLLYGITYLSQRLSERDPNIDFVLQNMKQAISKANDIVTDLLNFASLASIDKKSEDLKSIVEKSLVLVHHEFTRNRISVIKKYEQSLPLVKVDHNRIEQVLINLILNAVHAMPEGGDLIIRTFSRLLSEDLEDFPQLQRNEFRPGELITVLMIEDCGCGIPEASIDRIFDPFFTTRRGSGGVGLGLSVSKNIMDIHAGSIFIENKRDGGARATLIFKAENLIRKGSGRHHEQEKDINYR